MAGEDIFKNPDLKKKKLSQMSTLIQLPNFTRKWHTTFSDFKFKILSFTSKFWEKRIRIKFPTNISEFRLFSQSSEDLFNSNLTMHPLLLLTVAPKVDYTSRPWTVIIEDTANKIKASQLSNYQRPFSSSITDQYEGPQAHHLNFAENRMK